MFACRDDSAGAASQCIVSVAGGGSYTGAMLIVHATAGIVPPTWLDTILANGVTGVPGSSTVPVVTLGSPDDAANRAMACFQTDGPTATFAPDAGWSLIGTELQMTSPTVRLRVISRFDSFDTTPSGVMSAAVGWTGVGSEWEQG